MDINTKILEYKEFPRNLKELIISNKKINENPSYISIINEIDKSYMSYRKLYGTQDSQFSELYVKLIDDIEEVSDVQFINKVIDVVFNFKKPLLNGSTNLQLSSYIKDVMTDFDKDMDKLYNGENVLTSEFFFNLGRSRAVTDIFIDDNNNQDYFDDIRFLKLNLDKEEFFKKYF